jgi:hypothetical protein
MEKPARLVRFPQVVLKVAGDVPMKFLLTLSQPFLPAFKGLSQGHGGRE